MRVLWITNIMMPPICEFLGLPVPNVGGWMFSSIKSLLTFYSEIELAVATIYNGNELKKYEIDGIRYYLLPSNGSNIEYNKSLEPLWRSINEDFRPDLAHLHGTEFAHGLAFLKACPNVKTVVSIQGLVSVISRYYLAGISSKELSHLHTFHDIIKRTSIKKNQLEFERRGIIEREIIQRCKNIIGRTSWDRSQTWAINPNAQYYLCNETLRSLFYENKWTYQNCEPHSIFISQAGYPVKGLHQFLKSMPLILRRFPDTRVYVAGRNIVDVSSFSKRIRYTGYGKYITKLIEKLSLQNHVIFTGSLNEEQMCSQFLKANVFVSPSSIENSPNSLGEAQLLGVPCIASYVGGTPDMMEGSEEYLYRFEEIEMLADKVCSLFDLREMVDTSMMRQKAFNRHDPKLNTKSLYAIYVNILNANV